MATGLLPLTARDGDAGAFESETASVDGSDASQSSTVGATSTNPAIALPASVGDSNIALTAPNTPSTAASAATAESTPLAPVELQDAVGGGLGVETSLELAYENSGSLTPEGAPASLLAVAGPVGQVRVAREKLAGSPRADRIVGGPGKNEIDGREGNDELVGGASDDIFIGGAGDDVVDGGLGYDTARYRGSVLEYDITRISSTQARVRHARFGPGQNEGNDLVRNLKRLDFKDRQVFLDGSNNAPIAQADEGLSTVDGRSLTIPFSRLLGNDVDFDGDALTITQVKGKPANSVRIVGNSVVFTPPAGIQWALADFTSYETSFLYTVSDGKGGTATTIGERHHQPPKRPARASHGSGGHFTGGSRRARRISRRDLHEGVGSVCDRHELGRPYPGAELGRHDGRYRRWRRGRR